MRSRTARAVVRVAGDGEVVDRNARDIKCEIGSLLHKGDVPREDAVVVARLRAAGALILGTTNCPEFLMAYETANLLHGRTSNPWDLERTPGGSSGGESAAIAAGMSAAGLGSDSGGSVRVPAHFTGICSLKPTPGRIPGQRTSAAVRGAVFDARRDWADGADDGGCGVAVSHAERAGPARSSESAGGAARAEPGRAAGEYDWIF